MKFMVWGLVGFIAHRSRFSGLAITFHFPWAIAFLK